MPRPERSNNAHPSSRARAASAEDTEGWVTTSSSAAAVTDPPRTTASSALSCVTVIDTNLVLQQHVLIAARDLPPAGHGLWRPPMNTPSRIRTGDLLRERQAS